MLNLLMAVIFVPMLIEVDYTQIVFVVTTALTFLLTVWRIVGLIVDTLHKLSDQVAGLLNPQHK